MDFKTLREFTCKFHTPVYNGGIIVFAENEEMAEKTAMEYLGKGEFLLFSIISTKPVQTISGVAYVTSINLENE